MLTWFRRWGWLASLAAGVPGLCAYFLIPGADRDSIYSVFGIACVVAMLAGTALFDSRTKPWWRVCAVGIALIVLGDAIYGVLEKQGLSPFPSVADAAYLAGYLVFALGVARLVEPDARGLLRPSLLDSALLATGVAIFAWLWIIAPLTASSGNALATTIAIAYPAVDLVLVLVLIRHILTTTHKSPSLWLLLAGVGTFLAADFTYTSMSINGTYEGGMLVDIGWLAGYALIGAAALHPSMVRLAVSDTAFDPVSNRRIALIVLAVVIPACALLFAPRESTGDFVAVVGSTTVLATLAITRLVTSLMRTRDLLTEAKDLRDQVVKQAHTDALTGLPNRMTFLDSLRTALANTPGGAGLLFLDLDQFKGINDTWGHSAGDELLIAAAGRLLGAVRKGDTVARLGGDEFGIVVTPASGGTAAVLAERILATFERPFALAEASVSVHLSIGLVVGLPGDDAARLLRQADLAMYDAKARGGRRWQAFDTSQEVIVERYRLANELEQAIGSSQLVIHYQPILDLDTDAIVAVEALVRWQHPVRGLLQPNSFIPVAEAAGLIDALDRAVLRDALGQVRRWMDQGLWSPSQRVHVNIAPSELEDPTIVDVISAALRDTGVPAGALSLEVTESGLLEVDRTRSVLEQIAALGVSLSLDDFGTRYSVLAALSDLPFRTLKIDRSFVLALENPARARLFEGIVTLAERLGLQTLAEGIETPEQRAAVRKHGCRLAQGFILGRPVPATELEAALRTTARASSPPPDALPAAGAAGGAGPRRLVPVGRQLVAEAAPKRLRGAGSPVVSG